MWEYKHYKDNGPLFSEEFFEEIDKGLEKEKRCSRENEFPLVGILQAPDGSRYTGDAAKGGKNPYYRNLKLKRRFPAIQVHKAFFSRLKEIVQTNGLLEDVVAKAYGDRNFASQFTAEREKTQREEAGLQDIIDGFREALKKIVLKKDDNMTETINAVIEEKEKTQLEKQALSLRAAELDKKERNFKEALKGEAFKKSAKLLLENITKIPPLALKTFLKKLIPQAVIHLGEKENVLELCYNLGAEKETKKAFSPRKTPKLAIVPPFRGQEDSRWTSIGDGGERWIRTTEG